MNVLGSCMHFNPLYNAVANSSLSYLCLCECKSDYKREKGAWIELQIIKGWSLWFLDCAGWLICCTVMDNT